MLAPGEWIDLRGLLVTRASRIATDLLADHEDPQAVGHVIADSLRQVFDYPGTTAAALGPQARRFGLESGDGLALLAWLLDLTGAPERDAWLAEARASLAREQEGGNRS